MHFEFLGTPAQAAAIGANLGLVYLSGAPADASAGTARPLLRLGAQGDPVRLLQKGLNDHGSHLGVDGDFGRHTLGCVIGFQRGANLLPDGVVGPKTWSALG